MSTLTKVFAVLLVFVCIAFSMSVTQFLVTSRNEATRANDAEAKLAAAEAAAVRANLKHMNVQRLLNDEHSTRLREATQAQTDQKSLERLLNTARTNEADLRTNLLAAQQIQTNALALATNAQTLYQQMTLEVKRLRGDVAAQIADATKLRDEKRNLVREIDGYKFRIERLNKQIRDLNDTNRDLRDRLLAAAGSGGIAQARGRTNVAGEVQPAGDIDGPLYGQIMSVSNNLAVISVGEDDGVSKGMKFLVYRGEKLLATFVADKVEPQQTAGMLINVKTEIKGGDNVLSNPRLF